MPPLCQDGHQVVCQVAPSQVEPLNGMRECKPLQHAHPTLLPGQQQAEASPHSELTRLCWASFALTLLRCPVPDCYPCGPPTATRRPLRQTVIMPAVGAWAFPLQSSPSPCHYPPAETSHTRHDSMQRRLKKLRLGANLQ